MAPPRSKVLLIAGSFMALALAALPAGAQQIPTPGVTPEAVREWTWYLAFPIALGTVGFLGLLAFSYLRLSSRFFGKEEPPELPQPRRRRVVGAVSSPAPVGPRVEQLGAASTTPPIPPAASVKTAAEQQPRPEAQRTPERPAAGAAAAPAATKTEAPPAPAAAKTEAPAPVATRAPTAPAPAASPEHVEPDQETYERELQAQLDKGADRRVAEGRAKAAAVRAARAKVSGAQPAAPAAPAAAPEKPPAEKVESAPTVPPPESPAAEAEQAEEPPKEVEAPPPAKEEPVAEAPPAKAPPGADKETFDRVLREQLDKGLAQPIAESRARAAAIRAAREKADAG